MTRRKKIVIEIAVVFFVVLGLLTYFADEIDFMLLPQVKVSEPLVDYSSIKREGYYFIKCYIPKSAVVFDGEKAVVYAINEYYNDDESITHTVYSIDIDIMDSDGPYYITPLKDGYGSISATDQLVYYTSKPLSEGDRVFIAEEN